jgi:hypothetical protein
VDKGKGNGVESSKHQISGSLAKTESCSESVEKGRFDIQIITFQVLKDALKIAEIDPRKGISGIASQQC